MMLQRYLGNRVPPGKRTADQYRRYRSVGRFVSVEDDENSGTRSRQSRLPGWLDDCDEDITKKYKRADSKDFGSAWWAVLNTLRAAGFRSRFGQLLR